MSTVEIEEKSVEEAIETACQRLNLSADQLEIEIVSQGSSGIFGIGTRKAKILVSPKESGDDTSLEEAREILENILAHIQVPTTVQATWAEDR
ncbi:MAG: Jag N-terminal domain-containing protein, partial [Deltaproteobacteria bacterium]|nr:Jag N-terminal domain-containing protein [Deltaproteobacteria bacterium]